MNTSSISTIFDQALRARHQLESAWSSETAYQGITLTPGDPQSRGQCGVSSLWLARTLLAKGYNAQFAEGTLNTGSQEEDFVWVHLEAPSGETLVADVTSDQFQTVHGTGVHVGGYRSGPGIIGSYLLQRTFHPYEVPRKKLLRRFDILERNLQHNRFCYAGLKRLLRGMG